ncbi:MAG TPA: L-threonylcarbamoyladenylate synthase [Terriglobales bacterium]|nr:L-threonylcarbamoyladenylate synthase [Terriglobales bacterium]
MRVVPFGDREAQQAALAGIVAHVRAGGVIVYPTETVFGIGGAASLESVRRVAELKGRAETKPFLLLVSDEAQAQGLEWTETARRLADAFWPGPLTIVLRDTARRYPQGVTSADGGVAIRRTPHAGMRLLLDELGEPVTSTSANAPGEPPARTTAEAERALRALGDADDVWLLDGAAGDAPPSTVVDCTRDRPRLVRAGAVPLERLREVVDVVEG